MHNQKDKLMTDDFVGESAIMTRLLMSWPHICALVEHERLPIRWVDGQTVLTVADLEGWEAARVAQ